MGQGDHKMEGLGVNSQVMARGYRGGESRGIRKVKSSSGRSTGPEQLGLGYDEQVHRVTEKAIH